MRTRAVPVRVRFVELSRERIKAVAGKRFSVRVLTRREFVRLALRRRAGSRHAAGARAAGAGDAGAVHAVRDGRRPCGSRRRRRRRGPGPVSRPLVVLGVSRSGTTLLRVMLDRSPGIAIPDESFFVPLLARRHGRTIDAERFLDDVGADPDDPRLGLRARRRRAADPRRGWRPATRSRRSSRRTPRGPASRAGGTRRRCTCATSRFSSASSRTRSTST